MSCLFGIFWPQVLSSTERVLGTTKKSILLFLLLKIRFVASKEDSISYVEENNILLRGKEISVNSNFFLWSFCL